MALALIIGYVLGSIPTALVVGRFKRVDPRLRGDGNPGWWNMRGLVGDRVAAFVLVGDMLKGVAAVWIGSHIWGPWWTEYVALFGAMVGHAFPLFGDFRGGRAVVTFMGGMLMIAPLPSILALAMAAAILPFVRRPIYGARLAVLLVAPLQALWMPRAMVFATLALMSFVAVRFLLARPLRPGLPAEMGRL